MKLRLYLLAACLLLLTLTGCSGADKTAAEWNCTVHCMEESAGDAYVITYSEKEITSATGTLTFQNRNEFPVTVHLTGGGSEVFSAVVEAGGNTAYLQAGKDTVYTVGIHADVAEGTEIRLVVYDGMRSDVY